MLDELTTLPPDTLLNMVLTILAGGQTLTSSDVDELEQIQVELQRRGEIDARSYQA